MVSKRLLDNVGVFDLGQNLKFAFQQLDEILALVGDRDRHDFDCHNKAGVILLVPPVDCSKSALRR